MKVDIKFAVKAKLEDGREIPGVVVARFDLDITAAPWPGQSWDGNTPDTSPGKHLEIRVLKLIEAAISDGGRTQLSSERQSTS
jgi:hypothetical protein